MKSYIILIQLMSSQKYDVFYNVANKGRSEQEMIIFTFVKLCVEAVNQTDCIFMPYTEG